MRILRSIALASISLVALAGSAQAQSSGAADNDENASVDDTIIVQARRRDESVQDVPQVINAVTAEQIDKLNIRDVREITTVVPGLSLVSNSNGIGSSSSMRGVNHDVNVSGNNGTIQYYINDVPVSSNLALQAMFDIGQITVERGPQGTLRGRSTPSGAININWRKPDLSEVGGTASLTFGEGETRNVQFGVGAPIIKDVLAIRVAGLRDVSQGNRIRSINHNEEPRVKTDAIRASLAFEPVDFFKAGFVYEGMRFNATQFDQVESMKAAVPGFTVPAVDRAITASIAPFTAPFPSTSLAGNYGTITLADRKAVMFSPRIVSTTFRFFQWNAEASFAGQRLIYVGADTRTKFHPITNSDIGAVWPNLTLRQDTQTKSNDVSHEVRLQNDERIAGMFDYVIGYFNQKGGSETVLSSPSVLEIYSPIFAGGGDMRLYNVATLANNTPIYLAPGTTREESFFGNLTAYLGQGTEISGGLRHIKFKNDAKGLFISCTPAAYAAGSCTVTPNTNNNYDLSHTIYSASIRHRFSDDLMVYASTGSSARPPVRAIGNFSIRYSPLELVHTTFGSETSKSYEAGFKSSWLDRKVRLNATYYHQTFQNYPFRAAGAGIYYINVNSSNQDTRSRFNFISAVPVKVDGVEADLAYNPSDNFSLSTTLNWSKSAISKNAKVACTDVNKDGIQDTAIPTLAQLQAAYGTEHLAQCAASGSATFLPEWSGTVQAEYNADLTDSMKGYVRGLLAWKGSTKNDPANAIDDVGSYGIVNLYAGLRAADGSWELGAYVKNVGNVTRLVSGDGAALDNSTTMLFSAGGTPSPIGSQTYTSNYRGVAVTAPREFGVTMRYSFGSR
ncbi:TonB-dependent receptor [Novosphingobium sp. TH158]|uniref:TonB-dependent receptor n=1 Tax=Novosphingobium sp. TH158 TaxID=2067455 RepID=UPI001304639D|nr:TonB-dependent receptor [Novosphingobium sp. TH158]